MTGVFGRANRSVPADVYGNLAQQERMDIGTCLPGQCIAFDPKTGKGTIRVMYKPVFNGKAIDFPDLVEVPIDQPRTGTFAMTMGNPVGSYGMVNFTARDQDVWDETGEAAEPNTARYNSFSDGRFSPGANPSTRAHSNYDNENMFFGTVDHVNGFRVTPGGTIAIEGKGESLMAILSELLEALSNDTLIINYGSSKGSGHALQFQAKYGELLGRLNTMKFR